jgi:hypothetical protein
MVNTTSKLQPREALARLQSLIGGDAQHRRFSGDIAGSAFTLMRYQSLGNSIFRPQFSGVLRPTESGCLITGDFKDFSPAASTILKTWFVFAALWTIATTILAATPGQRANWPLPVAGFALILVGILLVRFARSYYDSDRAIILRVLSDDFTG